MKSLKFILIVITLFFLVAVLSCGRKTTSPDEPTDLELTPRENVEAEEAAIMLSGDLVAPQDLYEVLMEGFGLLREKYADSIPYVNIRFSLPYGPSTIGLMMSDSAGDEIIAGNYFAWDSLNARYKCSTIDTVIFPWGLCVSIVFEGRYNVYLLSDNYANLPGVEVAEPGQGRIDRPITYVWFYDVANLAYLVRDAWGDCEAGCACSHFYYFKQQSDDIIFIGDWGPEYEDGQLIPPPGWWEEAHTALQEIYGWY